jgi:NodT family efflux transporter outer membrane factor (OMF) lipoprotein
MKHLLPILLLTGCATGPRYAPPVSPAALERPYANARTPAAADPTRLERWWTQMGDPVLDALIADTLARNLDLDAARARLRRARAQRGVTRAGSLPTLNGAGAAQRRQTGDATVTLNVDELPSEFEKSNRIPDTSFELYQVGFDAAWEADLFGANRARIRADDARVAAAAFDIEDVRSSIAAEVARDYLVVREMQVRLVILRRSLALARRTQALAREQERAGLVTEADTARTDAQLLAIEAQVPQSELLELQAAQRLAVLAAREPAALRDTLARPRPIPLPGPTAAGIPSELLLRRPDVRGAERRLAAATDAEAAAVRDLYPRLSLSASYGGVRTAGLIEWSSTLLALGANLTAPIFDGGRRQAYVETRRAEREEALATYRASVLNAFREVEDTLAASVRNLERSVLAERTVDRRRRARILLDEQYRAGLIGLLDLLIAERDLAEAETLAANARAQVAVDWIGLQKALGGGWQVAPTAAMKEKGT